MQIRIRIQPILIKYLYFEIIQKHPLNSFKKKNLNNYLPFSIQYYCPIVKTVQNSQFYIYALSLFAGSGSGTNNSGSGSGKKFRIRPDPDPQHCKKDNKGKRPVRGTFGLMFAGSGSETNNYEAGSSVNSGSNAREDLN